MDLQTEREIKFEVEPGWALPDLSGVVPDDLVVEPVTVVHLVSEYYDTADRALLARGITLRRRSGESDNGWHLKVPADDDDTRTEHRVPLGTSTRVPKVLLDRVAGLTRGQRVVKMVTMRTERTVQRWTDAAGTTAVEVADDVVTAVAPGARAATLTAWREVEVELGPDADSDLLAGLGKKLRKAGAQRSGSANKVARAVGAPSGERPVPKKPRALDVVLAYLDTQFEALVTGDLKLRAGDDDVHATRVGTRRFRSTLRVFGDLFDTDAVRHLDEELRWYAGLLGEVRDPAVQEERYLDMLAELPEELVLGPVAAQIDAELTGSRVRARAALRAEMSSPRYFALLDVLSGFLSDPPATEAARRKPKTLLPYLDRAAKKARKRLRRGLEAGNEAAGLDRAHLLHQARKAGKRARYAAELLEPVLGKDSSAVIAASYTDLQDILGDHQDIQVSTEVLRRLATATASRPDQNGFTFGVLYQREVDKAAGLEDAAGRWLIGM